MEIKQCEVVGGDFVCVRVAGHSGPCDTVSREVFDKVMKVEDRHFLYGTSPSDVVVDDVFAAARRTGKQELSVLYMHQLGWSKPSSKLDRFVRDLKIPVQYPQAYTQALELIR